MRSRITPSVHATNPTKSGSKKTYSFDHPIQDKNLKVAIKPSLRLSTLEARWALVTKNPNTLFHKFNVDASRIRFAFKGDDEFVAANKLLAFRNQPK